MSVAAAQCILTVPIYVAMFVSNSLYCLCVASLFYALWWQHKQLVIPIIFTVMIILTGLLFKVIIGVKATTSTCCMGFVLTHTYSLPSLHAAIVIFLCAYYIRPLFHQLYTIPDPERQEIAITKMTENECWVRLVVLVLYAILVCYSRVYLILNSIVDVIVGIVLGLLFHGLEMKIGLELHNRLPPLFKVE